MKNAKFLGFIFLALFLVVTGVVGLFGVVHPFVPTLLSILALVSGVLFLVCVAGCFSGHCCGVDKRGDFDKRGDL